MSESLEKLKRWNTTFSSYMLRIVWCMRVIRYTYWTQMYENDNKALMFFLRHDGVSIHWCFVGGTYFKLHFLAHVR